MNVDALIPTLGHVETALRVPGTFSGGNQAT